MKIIGDFVHLDSIQKCFLSENKAYIEIMDDDNQMMRISTDVFARALCTFLDEYTFGVLGCREGFEDFIKEIKSEFCR